MTQSSVPKRVEPSEKDFAEPALRKKMFNHALLRLKRIDLADDAVQEAMARAWEKRRDYDPGVTVLDAWVFGFLRLVICEIDRKIRKKSTLPLSEETGWKEMQALFELGEDNQQLQELLGRLSEDDRKLVVWHHLDNYSHNEISEKIGISTGNSRVMLARAMGKLKDLAKVGGAR